MIRSSSLLRPDLTIYSRGTVPRCGSVPLTQALGPPQFTGDAIVRSKSYVPAIVLIVLGTYFLLEKQHLIPSIGPLFRDWWPAILIAVGVLLLIRQSRRGG